MVISLLVALGANIALGAERIADITKLSDLKPTIESLLRRNVLQVEGDRYSLSQILVEPFQQQWDRTPWMEHITAYFTNWLQQKQRPLQQLQDHSDALLSVLEWAVQSRRWATVLHLGRAVEGVLAISGQWDTWAMVLQWILEAAQMTGDRAFEAFALHQLGTRSLCLNETTTAYDYLTQALHIRESLHDPAGLAATRHNLNILSAPLPTPSPSPSPAPIPPPPQHKRPFILGASAGVLLLALGLPFLTSQCSDRTPIVTPPTITPTATPTITPTVSLQPPQLKALELPQRVNWSQPIKGTIRLNSPAPNEGVEVILGVKGNADFVRGMPEKIKIASNSLTATFSFSTPESSARYLRGGQVEIVATCPQCQGPPQSQRLTILPSRQPQPQPPQLKLLELPEQVDWGQPVKGTIRLNSPAPNEGVEVILGVKGNADFVRGMPEKIKIASNSLTATFSFSTPESSERYLRGGQVEIVATCPQCQGPPQSQRLTILPSRQPQPQPPQLKSVELPRRVGWGQPVKGTITLSSPAPNEGIEVVLEAQGDDYFVREMPRRVSIDPNSATGVFSFMTPKDGSNYPRGGRVNIVATCPRCQGSSQSQWLTIIPFRQPIAPRDGGSTTPVPSLRPAPATQPPLLF